MTRLFWLLEAKVLDIRLIQEESQLGETQSIVYGQDEAGNSQSFQSQDVDLAEAGRGDAFQQSRWLSGPSGGFRQGR